VSEFLRLRSHGRARATYPHGCGRKPNTIWPIRRRGRTLAALSASLWRRLPHPAAVKVMVSKPLTMIGRMI